MGRYTSSLGNTSLTPISHLICSKHCRSKVDLAIENYRKKYLSNELCTTAEINKDKVPIPAVSTSEGGQIRSN